MVNKEKAFQTLQKCMNNLYGGSGHLASYFLLENTFEITEESYKYGLCRIEFTVEGLHESEFQHKDEIRENLIGSITLLPDYTPAFDGENNVILSPWKCLLKPDRFQRQSKTVKPPAPASKGEGVLSEDEVDYLLSDLD